MNNHAPFIDLNLADILAGDRDFPGRGIFLIADGNVREAAFDVAIGNNARSKKLQYLVITAAPNVPFAAWRGVVGSLIARTEGLSVTHRKVLENMLAPLAGTDVLSRLSTHHALYRTFDAVRELVARASERLPLVIFFPRAHELDLDSLRLMRFLQPFVSDMPVLMIAGVNISNQSAAAGIHGELQSLPLMRVREWPAGPDASSAFAVRAPAARFVEKPTAATAWARSLGSAEFAARWLTSAYTEASERATQWCLLTQLVELHAESGRTDEAIRHLLALLDHPETEHLSRDELSSLAVLYFEAGLTREQLSPLLRRLAGSDRDVAWARITLLDPPKIINVANGRVTQGRWLGVNQQATTLVRESGTDADFARTLYVYDWLSRDDLEVLLSVSKNWSSQTARSRALSVVAEALMYRFGEFALACTLLEQQANMHRLSGALEEEAKSLVRLSMARLANGELDRADDVRIDAREKVRRLGPNYLIYEHAGTKSGGDLYPEISMESNFAWYREGDWLAVAEHWAKAVAMHEGSGSPVHIVEAAMAAQAYARLNRFDDARLYLDELTGILPQLQPRDWAFNGAVGRAAHAIWDMLDMHYASDFLGYATTLMAAGVGDWTNTSLDLSAARMAALLGKHTAATEHFERARARLTKEQSPQRSIIDFDEAIALRLAGNREPDRRACLIGSAKTGFAINRMNGWLVRAEREALEMA